MMPEGVEHLNGRGRCWAVAGVTDSMMPEGVEHQDSAFNMEAVLR